MQKFYEEIISSTDDKPNWKIDLTRVSLETLKAFEDNALAWEIWDGKPEN